MFNLDDLDSPILNYASTSTGVTRAVVATTR